MTPKEKAKELLGKFLKNMPSPDSTNALVDVIARECALTAVDEIVKLDALHNLPLTRGYWQEVKQEIEKL